MREGDAAAAGSWRPRLRPWYRVSAREDGTVLRYGGSVLELGGRSAVELLPRLLPLLDGTRTVDDIVECLGEPARVAVQDALRVLEEHRLLTEATPAGVTEARRRTAEFLAASDAFGRRPADMLETLAGTAVCVVGASGVAALVASLVADAGAERLERLDWDDALPDGALAIVAPADDELPRLPAWNEQALAAGTEWLQVLPFDGLLAAVGPIFVPGQTACHVCYRLRRSANLSPVPDDAVGAYPGCPAFDAILAGLAATVALRRLVLADGLAVGVLLAVERPAELRCTRHFVHRVPRCPACSRASRVAAVSPWQGVAERGG